MYISMISSYIIRILAVALLPYKKSCFHKQVFCIFSKKCRNSLLCPRSFVEIRQKNNAWTFFSLMNSCVSAVVSSYAKRKVVCLSEKIIVFWYYNSTLSICKVLYIVFYYIYTCTIAKLWLFNFQSSVYLDETWHILLWGLRQITVKYREKWRLI